MCAFVALGTFGAAFGALIAGFSQDWIGRKKTILISTILFFVGNALVGIGPIRAFYTLLGRFLIGFSIGTTSMATPLYITELTPPALRGRMISIYVLLNAVGVFAAQAIGIMINLQWRYLFYAGAVMSFLQFIGLCYLPQSPRWLAGKGNIKKAEIGLKMMYKKEYQQI